MNKNILHSLILIAIAIVAILTKTLWVSTSGEFIFAALCIMIAGVPHGSLDYEIAKSTRVHFHLISFLFFYTLIAASYLVVWMFWPGLAFVLFLVFTAWHFGETDLNCFQAEQSSWWMTVIYGISLTMWLLVQDKELILYWTNIVAQKSVFAGQIMQSVASVPIYGWFIGLSIMPIMQLLQKRTSPLLVVLFLLFIFLLSYTSLIIGFVIYFTGWHSMHALLHIKKTAFKQVRFIKMMTKALVPTIGAAILLAAIGYFGQSSWLQHQGLPALFVLLSVLTLPHMLEMHKLYQIRINDHQASKP